MSDDLQPDTPARRTRDRRLVLVLVAVVVVAALAAAAWFLFGGNGAQTAQTPPTATPTASPTESSTPEPTAEPQPTPTIDPDFGQPVGDQAPQGEPADLGDGLTAELVEVTPVTAEGTQVGEVGGPALQVDLEIVNGSDAPFSLDGVTVNAYYGADRTPAPPYFEPADAKFSGTLDPGKAADGRYVFRVPEAEQASTVITVSRGAGSPLVVLG